jgi:hypothetical protein
LAGDLGLFDEAADQLGPPTMLFKQDLDSQHAADEMVAALEHGAHAAAGDLVQELEPDAGIVVGERSRVGSAIGPWAIVKASRPR